jgi:hypothetical protein
MGSGKTNNNGARRTTHDAWNAVYPVSGGIEGLLRRFAPRNDDGC